MKFNKNLSEIKNLEILNKEIKKGKSTYSQILVDSLSNAANSDEFRNLIKTKVSQYIENKIK